MQGASSVSRDRFKAMVVAVCSSLATYAAFRKREPPPLEEVQDWRASATVFPIDSMIRLVCANFAVLRSLLLRLIAPPPRVGSQRCFLKRLHWLSYLRGIGDLPCSTSATCRNGLHVRWPYLQNSKAVEPSTAPLSCDLTGKDLNSICPTSYEPHRAVVKIL